MSLKWLPNAVTIARCVLAIFVGYTILDLDIQLRSGDPATLGLFFPFVLFVIAAASDWVDGALARGLNAESAFGARLDPIADKLLAASSLLALCHLERWSWIITVPAIAIIARDVLITAMREAMGNPGSMKVSNAAKWKTAIILSGIGAILFGLAISELTHNADPYSPVWVLTRGVLLIGILMVWVSAALAVMTAWDYVAGASEKSDEPYQ
ncbi:CDP-alcohol phosphatidyltransferase family protein [Henriciella litoralis]|uniref:CDP-alcohol phosphatidyltransferase family protein n=1 Tax=Henriciella litoralis TaxID=568102 RepID=UPI000A0783E8|nr:CDP-alcohol phosphatidyltransferase family protein [Henriciella litoralis]